MFEYERVSHLLYHYFETVRDPKALDPETRENYRELIRLVDKMAHLMGHYTKSLDILRHLEFFGDRELDAEELKRLGTAYIWAGYEVTEDKKREYWGKSVALLETARKKNPHDEHALYNLGWILLTLGKHHDAIECMNTCMNQNPAVAPWAKWNIACSQVKLGDMRGAIATLAEIPPGAWWSRILRDTDFGPLQQDPTLGDRFRALCQERQRPQQGN